MTSAGQVQLTLAILVMTSQTLQLSGLKIIKTKQNNSLHIWKWRY